jgi:hypothetical protein
MGKFIAGGAALSLLLVATSLALRADEEKKPVAIKEVMKVCMKEGLCKKVADGQASEEETKKLLAMFEDLAKNKPKKGDADSWNTKTGALVAAAKLAVEKDAGAGAKLKEAANCKACHDAHKG